MSKISEMQGVSAHLTYLKSKDVRRHPAKCIFSEGKGKSRICTSPQSNKYMQNCNSAQRCDYYEVKKLLANE